MLPAVHGLQMAAPKHRQIRIIQPRLVLWRQYGRILDLFLLLCLGLLLKFSQLCRSLSPLCAIGAHVHDSVQWVDTLPSETLHLAVGEVFVVLAAFQFLINVTILCFPEQVLHLHFLLLLLLGRICLRGKGGCCGVHVDSRDSCHISSLTLAQNHSLNGLTSRIFRKLEILAHSLRRYRELPIHKACTTSAQRRLICLDRFDLRRRSHTLLVSIDHINVTWSILAILAASKIEKLELVQRSVINSIIRLMIDDTAFHAGAQ